jgi:predicted helicase
MNIQTYIDKINTRFKSHITTEHSFRGDLQNLLETLLPDILTTNEPTRIKCGAPDYILTKKDIPVGYIEAKDLGADLNSKSYQEQFKRYKAALNNLIITNYLDFQVFKDGVLVAEYSIGTISGDTVQGKPEQFDAFTAQIKDFATTTGQTIKSASKLAGMMAVKAKMLAEVIGSALISDEENEANSTLKDQLKAFKDILIHDIGAKEFADIYAQTIAYGMFAARLHDHTLPTFSRQEAAELIPKTNPFLRKLFQYVAGYDLDMRIVWIVDALADIFRATDVKAILNNFGKATQQNDPIIHFYETFLSEYDPKLRKARGVWYTPEPVVKFIVRAVDDILKTEFGLPDGLADTNKTKIKVKVPTHDKRYTAGLRDYEQEVHKVQILDPATGTGTFLAEVIKYIYSGKFKGQQGIWSNYVENHLIPRINGFELLMASYAMAHLKLELLLTETGYKPKTEQRLRVYLTNSLEESHPETGTLFANWLSSEANEANQIKRDTPVMVVIGNPPYSGVSTNNGEWITNLINHYKYVDGEYFNERKHWLNDDYVKFIRFGQHFIEKNGEGVLAYINNHSFLDNPTFKGMRWHLLNTFDKIFIVDLHGNNKRREVSPDGSPDVNVFDIMQGVSINIFIKTGKKKAKELGSVFHFDVFGKRENKYSFLSENNLRNISFMKLDSIAPNFFFVPKDFKGQKGYDLGFNINELFPNSVTGIVTMGDSFIVADSKDVLMKRLRHFKENDVSENWLKTEFGLGKNYAEWVLKNKSSIIIDESKVTQIDYRPFDNRWTYFDNKLIWRWRIDTMQHFLKGENVGLMTCRQIAIDNWEHVGITKFIADDSRVSNRTKERGYIFPLYLYPQSFDKLGIDSEEKRTPNFNDKIIVELADRVGLNFINEKEETANTVAFAPIDVLDYIYAVLHSPAYREQYKEFLKIDFPRVPYPKDPATFWALVALGSEIRQLHLLEAPTVSKYITKYPVDGSNDVVKPAYKDGRVYINDSQYFDNVPQVAWEFYIGGYQPAQKWLKDRKESTLNFEDILHYQKMIVALTETDRIMKEIDKIDFM